MALVRVGLSDAICCIFLSQTLLQVFKHAVSYNIEQAMVLKQMDSISRHNRFESLVADSLCFTQRPAFNAGTFDPLTWVVHDIKRHFLCLYDCIYSSKAKCATVHCVNAYVIA